MRRAKCRFRMAACQSRQCYFWGDIYPPPASPRPGASRPVGEAGTLHRRELCGAVSKTDTTGQALLKLDRLAKIDIRHGAEFTVGGLEVFEDGEWVEWYTEDGLGIDEYASSLEAK